MIIGICALVFSSSLAICEFKRLTENHYKHTNSDHLPGMRVLLVRENKRLDQSELGSLKGATSNRQRIEEYAHLQGLTMDEALERKRGFRYLY